MTPKISIVMPTKQVSYPMDTLNVDIITLLISTLEDQNFKDIELIIVDYFYKDRKDLFKRVKTSFPIKYIPQRPTIWDEIEGSPQISSARNSGIVFAKGKITLCIDDCIYTDRNDMLSQIWWWWENYGIILRPLIDFRVKNKYEKDPDTEWISQIPSSSRFKELNAHRGNIYCYPTEAYLDLNGFDERYDGSWGSEDCDFSNRLDVFGLKRFVLSEKENQARFTRVGHIDMLDASLASSKFVKCNECYAQWSYRQISSGKKMFVNSEKLSSEQANEIVDFCYSERCSMYKAGICKRKDRVDAKYYLGKFQPVFDMRKERSKMLSRYGDRNGVFDPW